MQLEVKHLDFSYGDGKKVLSDINLNIGGDKLYCIIGPNGVGKSTFVKCLNKLLKPTGGEVLIDGRNVDDLSIREIAEDLSFIPVSQTYSFKMSVTDVVLLGRYDPRKWRTTEDDIRSVFKALQLMDLEEFSMRDINELSAGQCQKVNLCKGLVQQPKMMILDEPTSNLDVKHQMFVTELLRALSRENHMTVLMISHDLNIAAKFADEIIIMGEPGVIYDMGPPKDVITKESISRIYGVDCDVIDVDGAPHVILKSALSKKQMDDMRHEFGTSS